MPDASQPALTADQSSLHINNIAAHPGSTWAGVGVGLLTIGNQFQSGGLPTNKAGWIQLIMGTAFAVLAALGK